MATSRADTLPSGMRERTFALVHSDTNDVLMFGRGTDYPCSEYVFPAVETSGDKFSIHGNHASAFGQMDISSDYFEASFWTTEPHAADKMSRIVSAWTMANFQRPRSGLHHLYYVLGGRTRMMYGVPDRIAPKYNGFKTSFHEGILRFATSSPFYFDSREVTADSGTMIPALATGATYTSTFFTESYTEVPTPLSFDIWTDNDTVKLDVKVEIRNAEGGWRTVLLLEGMDGRMKIDNFPGRATSSHEPPNVTPSTPMTTGADLISPSTPAFRNMLLWPGDDQFRVSVTSKNSVAADVAAIIKWRDCYAGA